MVFSSCLISKEMSITFNGITIHCSHFELHLGNRLYTCNYAHNSKFEHAEYKVKYFLFKSYCMSVYGSSLWNFEDSATEKFFVAWRKCCRRLLKVPSNTHCNILHMLVNDDDIDVQLHRRQLKFVTSLINSDNTIIQLCCRLALNGSGSIISNSINYLCCKYQISKMDLTKVQKVNKELDETVIEISNIVIDFLNLRDSVYDFCDKTNYQHIIEPNYVFPDLFKCNSFAICES